MGKRKRRQAAINPRNKNSQKQPDFALLASLYSTFKPFVFYSRDGRPRIDWTDYNATRELTRVLLLHDHGITWWIPDGQLCPAVPNRSNYIHWIASLLSLDIFLQAENVGDPVRGFDIGTGANCIYPLLGATLYGWHFVGSDAAEVALEWASKNTECNPQISGLIEIRRAVNYDCGEDDRSKMPSSSSDYLHHDDRGTRYTGPPVLMGVVKENERFDFCMCNPPFFSTMEETGLNPKTCYGGTPEEMVCYGGEFAFVNQIIQDSIILKDTFRWYTSMIGKKGNLKSLTLKLWEVGATVVKTTEFVQGQTSRWGIAWSFLPIMKTLSSSQSYQNSKFSFILEGVVQGSALDLLVSVEAYFRSSGALCLFNPASFSVNVKSAISTNAEENLDEKWNFPENMCIDISVFQQTPGTLVVMGSSTQSDATASGRLTAIMQRLQENLRGKFCAPNP